MEQLAPHEKVFVDPALMAEDGNHADIACHECHGGNPEDPDWLTAHTGLVRDPTLNDAERVCGDCHPDVVESWSRSLHATCAPIFRRIAARTTLDPKGLKQVEAAGKAHCGQCHASCGQCHVSRPTYVGGGLLDGHAFMRKPPMREVCTACHGSRVENEYFGKNKGVPPDAHWRKRFMDCLACHGGEEMHADGSKAANRYAMAQAPACRDCHLEIYSAFSENAEQHRTHMDKVDCRVCHAMPYKNCYNCHVATDRYGFKYFVNDASEMGFKIGRNPARTMERSDKYVVLRHAPVSKDIFAFYLDKGLERFEALPTWEPASPHTIRRKTPQNRSCNACHGNARLFLLESDLGPGERKANRDVVLEPSMIPPPVDQGEGSEQ